ncbi:hypothetical protein E2C01_066832 [Portunus trituberculatus]|uniref:Uncharacterized protein n=1 Tax=Portunus trituberculatus TaxID=210409 RepID=A0A5B7HMK9_PORTR|nr:hypothetical protein [Portunus trituberculatus]
MAVLVLTLQSPRPVPPLAPPPHTEDTTRLTVEAAKIHILTVLSCVEVPTHLPDITQAGHARCEKQEIRDTLVSRKEKKHQVAPRDVTTQTRAENFILGAKHTPEGACFLPPI